MKQPPDEVVAAIRDNTRHAGRRKNRRRYGKALTTAIVLATVALTYFGARSI